ncbi:MAG: oligosaccharide repeat unit polymerase, partial [Patescibacteria group bacterium]
FGHRIGVLADDDRITGVGPTVVGYWLINFGLAGVVFGMFLMGMLFRLIYEYLIKRTKTSLSGVMIYSVLWVQIIKGMEDWVAPVYVGVIRTFVILLAINFLMSTKLFFKK